MEHSYSWASAKLTGLEDLVRAELRAPIAELVRRLIPELVDVTEGTRVYGIAWTVEEHPEGSGA